MWLALTFALAAPVHGTWVYARQGLDTARMALLEKSRTQSGLTELYVSVEALPLDDPRSPAKMHQLKQAGLRIEALFDGEDPEQWISRVLAFNRAQPDALSRFDGVHYDYEPWIGSGNNSAWVDRAVTMYNRASRALLDSRLVFSVDISGAKLAALSPSERMRLTRAAQRIVLMQYEAPIERVQSRSASVLRSTDKSGATFLIALRVKDFHCETTRALQQVEAAQQATQAYSGWAIYEYEDYASQCLAHSP